MWSRRWSSGRRGLISLISCWRCWTLTAHQSCAMPVWVSRHIHDAHTALQMNWSSRWMWSECAFSFSDVLKELVLLSPHDFLHTLVPFLQHNHCTYHHSNIPSESRRNSIHTALIIMMYNTVCVCVQCRLARTCPVERISSWWAERTTFVLPDRSSTCACCPRWWRPVRCVRDRCMIPVARWALGIHSVCFVFPVG